MKIVQGNIWDSIIHGPAWAGKGCQLLCITTNGIVRNTTDKNNLIMGAGIAKQAKDLYPLLPSLAAQVIEERGQLVSQELYLRKYLYGFLPVFYPQSGIILGLFQTKENWAENSRLSLIGYSTEMLASYIQYVGVERVSLNFPGIGLGGLERSKVLPIISSLSDIVTVYER